MININGKCDISATIIADSISEFGDRLTTFELVFPRWILSEFNTHRMLSRSVQSTRAVPFKKLIETIHDNTAFPVEWGKNKSGMQSEESLSELEQQSCKGVWEAARNSAISHAKVLSDIGLHKQWIGRLIENFCLVKAVVTGTDWDNFLWLRNDNAAQPEFHELARCIQECFDKSKPLELYKDEWHLPYIKTKRLLDNRVSDEHYIAYFDSNEESLSLEEAQKISASCTAQVSYRKLNESKEKALEIYSKLFSGPKPHMSPTEHQGTPIPISSTLNPPDWPKGVTHMKRNGKLCSGNLTGWISFRNTLPNNVYNKE
jgi:hypothetical protein